MTQTIEQFASQLQGFDNRNVALFTKEMRGKMNRARTAESRSFWLGRLVACEKELLKRIA